MPDPARDIPFDNNHLNQLMSDTKSIQGWLAARTPVDETPVAPMGPKLPGPSPSSVGNSKQPLDLDDRHKAVLRQLLQRSHWTMQQLRMLTSSVGLMPLACLARLNEWTADNYGDVLLEGEDPIIVNQNLKEKLHI